MEEIKNMQEVDVALILEGTYPYIAGGVSSWVHGIISGMPDLKFGLIYLSANYDAPKELKYKIPSNVEFLMEIAVFDLILCSFPKHRDIKSAWKEMKKFILGLQDGRIINFDEVFPYIADYRAKTLDMHDLIYSQNSWDLIIEIYKKKAPEISFIDFFWTWRYAYYPLFQMFNARIPCAKIYHSICTGWAGLLGVIAKKRFNRPLLLTEHGIYTNERRLEISQAQWIYTQEEDDLVLRKDLGYFKELWINMFNALGQLTYDYSEEIYTLYEGNKSMQISFGAQGEKIKVIPNGVNIEELKASASLISKDNHPTVGFVGRVVPIKDVKTFLRACRMVIDKIPDCKFLILGPYEEDPDYYEECKNLTELLALGDCLKYLGKVKVKEYYPKLDVLVLTSISEGQPLVILEGYCSGVPAVATQVGACKELIYGMNEEDKMLGESGIITQVGTPQETAEAIIKILTHQDLKQKMSQASQKRVNKYYDYKDMISCYRNIYERRL